jgi:hypothetical protein
MVAKVAEMAVLRIFFEHLYTDVKGVGSAKSILARRDNSSSAIPIIAHLCSLEE